MSVWTRIHEMSQEMIAFEKKLLELETALAKIVKGIRADVAVVKKETKNETNQESD